MRPTFAALVTTAVLAASCASGSGLPSGGATVLKAPCPNSGTCDVNVTMITSGTACYFLSDNIDVGRAASVDIAWKLVDSSGNPATKYNFVPNTGVVILPPEHYSNPRNTGKVFTWHHDPQQVDSNDVVELNISGKYGACTPWFIGANPYIRNR